MHHNLDPSHSTDDPHQGNTYLEMEDSNKQPNRGNPRGRTLMRRKVMRSKRTTYHCSIHHPRKHDCQMRRKSSWNYSREFINFWPSNLRIGVRMK